MIALKTQGNSMKLHNFTAILAVSVGLLLPEVGSAAMKPNHGLQLQDSLKVSGAKKRMRQRTANGKVDAETGVRRYEYAPDFSSSSGEKPRETAKRFLMRNADAYGMDEGLNTLEILDVINSPGGDHVYFRQVIDGVPVHGSHGSVSLSKKGKVSFASNQFRKAARGKKRGNSPYDRMDAVAVAKRHLKVKGTLRCAELAEMVWFETENNGVLLTWMVDIASHDPLGDWRVFVDARSGKIVDANELTQYQTQTTGVGNVFDPDPITSAHTQYGGDYVDNNDANSDVLDAELHTVMLRDITLTGGVYHLEGPFCTISDNEPPSDTYPTPTVSTGFIFNRSDQGFEAVNVYFHIDRMGRRINELGYFQHMSERIGSISSDPHGLYGDANACYRPLTNTLAFGEGGVDLAESGPVIYHEYGHALQYNLTVAGMPFDENNPEVGAVKEGCSDYWASTFARAIDEHDPYTLYKWTFPSNGWPHRRCDRTWRYPDHYPASTSNKYEGGQIFCTALMKIWEDLGRDITDRILLEAHLIWGASPQLDDAAMALITADENLYEGAHIGTLIEHLDAHGLFTGQTANAPWFSAIGTNVGETNDWDVFGADGADCEWHLHLEEATIVNVSTCSYNTDFDTKIEIFNCDRTTTGHRNNDAPCENGNQASILYDVPLAAGDYYIVVDGNNGATGIWNLMVWYSDPSEPHIAGLPFRHPFSTEGQSNNWDVQWSDGDDVAYSLSLSHQAAIDVTLCTEGTNYDTKLEIFNANGTTTGHYNDDAYCAFSGYYSSISNAVLAAGSYEIVVDGYNGKTGDFEIAVSYHSDFVVDNFPYEHSGSNYGQNNTWDVWLDDGADVCYKLILPQGGTFNVDLCGESDFDTQLEIFNEDGTRTGYHNDDCLHSCGNRSTNSCLDGMALAAGTYFVVVDGWEGDEGNYNLWMNYQPFLGVAPVVETDADGDGVDDRATALLNAAKHEAIKSGSSVQLVAPSAPKAFKADGDIDIFVYELEKQLNGGEPTLPALTGTTDSVSKKTVKEREKLERSKRSRK